MNEKEIIERIVAVEQRSKSNTKRLDEKDGKDAEQDNKIAALSDVYIALTKANDKIANIEDKVEDISKDLRAIKDKPTKRMDAIWGYIVSAIIVGLITFTFTVLGLRG